MNINPELAQDNKNLNKRPRKDKNLSYENINLYRAAREIIYVSTMVSSRMCKMYKYQLGQRLSDLSFNLSTNIYNAYINTDKDIKINYINIVLENIQQIIITYRIVNDIHQIGQDIYIEQVNKLIECERQAKVWREKIFSISPDSARDLTSENVK